MSDEISKTRETLHNQAMHIAELADWLEQRGLSRLRKDSAKLAMALEYSAAEMTDQGLSRSVLFRSAADLAVQGEDDESAAYIANKALMESPHSEIAQELKNILEGVRKRAEHG